MPDRPMPTQRVVIDYQLPAEPPPNWLLRAALEDRFTVRSARLHESASGVRLLLECEASRDRRPLMLGEQSVLTIRWVAMYAEHILPADTVWAGAYLPPNSDHLLNIYVDTSL